LGENLLLFGPPGVGKGTQAQRLSAALRIPHIATGDILRAAIQSHTPLGRQVAEYLDRGQLAPDEIMVEVIKERLARPDATRGFLLDGFPRTTRQAEVLTEILLEQKRPVDGVISLDAPTDELVARVAGRRTCESCQASYHVTAKPPKVAGICDRCGGVLKQRSDDSEEIIRNRLREFAAKTKPVLDYFLTNNWPVRMIDADGNMDQIFGRIYAAVLLS
jgi:adenylate kinase